MGKIKNALIKFLYGRYGTYGMDTLNKVITVSYLAWIVICAVAMIFLRHPIFWLVYIGVSLALAGWMTFRSFSRNIVARRRENDKFVNFFKLRKNKFKDRKTHVYRTCPSCKATLRLPRSKGVHSVICPRCKHRFEVKGR